MQSSEVQSTPPQPPPPAPKPRRARNFLLILVLLAAAFLGGYIPQRLEADRAKKELATLQLNHDLSELQRRLGVASHEAMRNNYASAAEAAKSFFAGCDDIVQKYPFENEPRTRNTLTTFAASRDAVMAQLVAGDPASKERLANMYLALNGVALRRE